jgi:glycosyltransferase involved in cell wall biosynthesis
VVIHNGIAPSDLSSPRTPTVGVLQRLEPEKGTDLALRAWAASRLGEVGWRLVVHGRGSQQNALEALAWKLNVAESVTFAGFVPDARAALASCGIFLATAPAEPFGLAVVEAMSVATPVVAADGGAHRETLGEEGRYFPPGDVDACAAQLRRLSADSAERTRIGKSLRQRQRAMFSVTTHVDHLEQVYLP